jgi:hypothetical protein
VLLLRPTGDQSRDERIDAERLVFDAGEPIGEAIPQGAHEVSRDATRLVSDPRRSAEIDDVDGKGVANLRRAEALQELIGAAGRASPAGRAAVSAWVSRDTWS